jgi:hypothetical protein
VQVWKSFIDNGGMFFQLGHLFLFNDTPRNQATMHDVFPMYVDAA